MSERRMLQEHGTRAISLSPHGVVSVARADLARRSRNMAAAAEGEHAFERFAFLPQHVKGAKSIAAVLLRAIRDLERRPELIKAKLKKRGSIASFHLYDEALIKKAILVARDVDISVAS